MLFGSVKSALRAVAALAVVAGMCLGLLPGVLTWRIHGLPRLPDLAAGQEAVYAILGGGALLALLGAMAAGVRLMERVRTVEKAAARAAAGRRAGPIPVQSRDEVARIASAVNRLTEQASHAEHEARRATLKLAALLEQSPDAILLFDPEGLVVDANVRARALLGKERATLTRYNLVALVADQPASRAEAYHAFMGCLRGTPALFETTLTAADGSPHPVEIHLAPLYGLRGAAAQAIIRDLTVRRERETARAEAAKMEGVGTLAAGIAHDFNNMLGGIMGYASLIKGSVVEGDPVFRYTDIIERSAARASELTEQLLGYARAGKMRLSRVRPQELADEVLSLLHQGMVLHRVKVRLQVDGNLPPLEGDAGQLHQVLTNLCLNARDAMPDGGDLTISIRARELAPGDGTLPLDTPDGSYVEIAVTDTGSGIPPEVRRRMFEPYFSTKPEGSGTGLGLAMSWGIIANHQGWIGVDSAPGRGTTMSVFLPAVRLSLVDEVAEFAGLASPLALPADPDDAAMPEVPAAPLAATPAVEPPLAITPATPVAPPTPAAPAATAGSTAPPPLLPELETPFRPRPVPAAAATPTEPAPRITGGHATILVVDDEQTLLEMARDILKSRGYGVVLARDGEEALHVYQRYGDAIDLVILDIVMPRMGGREAFRLLREMDPDVRVVVCSTFSRHGQAYDLLQAGADEFIQKPYRADDMLGVVKKVLDVGGSPPGRPRRHAASDHP
ncbi:MAG: response regulator [Nitrospirota bacterium]|nr:response regulator [Nitrospirota bacterium]